MARGWIAGVLTGAVVSGMGLATASLVMGPVTLAPEATAPAPEQAEPVSPAAATGAGTDVPGTTQGEESEIPPEPAAEPVAPVTAVEEQEIAQPEPAAEPEPLPEAEPEPVAVPEPAPLPEPEPVAVPEPAPMPEPERRLVTAPETAPESQPEAGADPEPEPEATPETEPAGGALPEPQGLPEQDTAQPDPVEPETPAAEPAGDMAGSDAPVVPLPADQTGSPVPPVPAAPAPADVTPRDQTPQPVPGVAGTAAEQAPVLPESGTPAEETDPEPKIAALPQIVVEAAPGAAAEGPIEIAPDADLAPALEASPAARVVTDRLPRIGDVPVEAAPEEAAPVPALLRNALPFATGADQPKLAFILRDTGPGDRAGLGDLGKLPFPVTVAVDASATDAETAIDFYRARGAEVMLEVPLPSGATATDVAVTLEAHKALLDRAVAVIVEEDLGFQSLGDGATELAVELAATGHGLVSFPEGLNTGHKTAIKEGVKAGLVFRDLDSEGQEGPVIRRFLDNAAFRARNEDGVIVLARTRPETVQALLEWSLGTRAQSVAIVPVSAVLSAE